MTRTCVGCRRRDVRSALLRVVAERGDAGEHIAGVIVDQRLRLAGRGAWLHPTPECLELAVRLKAFGRALRVRALLDAAAVAAYIEAREQSVVLMIPESESGFDADEHPMSTHS
ncbi:MAG: YlxR family protein [Actinomycetota bacterium]